MGSPRHGSLLRPAVLATAGALILGACGSGGIDDTGSLDALPSADTPQTSAPVEDNATNSTLGSELSTGTEPTVPVTTIETTTPSATPAGYVAVGTNQSSEGITFAMPESFDQIEPYAPFGPQADALNVDEAGRAGLLALEQQVGRGDFAFVSFDFNTGSERTDNVLVIRYDRSAVPDPAELADIYRTQVINGGGEVTSADVGVVDGREAVTLQLASAVNGQLLVDQMIILLYGDVFVHELTITVARPADDVALERMATISNSLRFAP